MLLYWYLLHYGLLLHIIAQYLCLFSLILQGLHEEGECRQLEFWTGKGANIRDLFCITPKVLKLHGELFWNKKILGEEGTRGGPPASHKGEGRALPPWARPPSLCAPGRPPMPIFCYMVCFDLEKIRRKLSGRSSAISRRNLGRTNLGLHRSCSPGKHPSGRGKLKPSSSLTILSISINILTSTISSQTLVHPLYSILVPKP